MRIDGAAPGRNAVINEISKIGLRIVRGGRKDVFAFSLSNAVAHQAAMLLQTGRQFRAEHPVAFGRIDLLAVVIHRHRDPTGCEGGVIQREVVARIDQLVLQDEPFLFRVRIALRGDAYAFAGLGLLRRLLDLQ